MAKILFICAGNVARSQMAEAFYNSLTHSTDAVSAGVLPYTPEKYVHPIPEVVEVMREIEIDFSRKLVKYVTKEMVDEADEIYILCPEETLPDFLSSSQKIHHWNIPDPFDADIDYFRSIRDLIQERVTKII